MTDEEAQLIRAVKARLNTKFMEAERYLAQRRASIQKRRDRKQPVAQAMEPTRSQIRLLKILGLTVPERFEWARHMLATAGYSGSGNPFMKDWRHTKYMSDSELVHETKDETYREEMRKNHAAANSAYQAALAKAGNAP